MKRAVVLLLVGVLVIVSLSYAVAFYLQGVGVDEEFFFGVSFGQNTAAEAKILIDKVKGFTNLFLINSWEIATNETALNEVCDYAAGAGLKFIVFFDLISRVMYPWHQTWLDAAKERWNNSFLGVHLRDELGGKQIDDAPVNKTVTVAVDYGEAADCYVSRIASFRSTADAKAKGIHMFISDYALYWFDYLAGYDTVFVELGWNHNTMQHIALCRGAASAQDKDWGAIIVWTYYEPPYLASGAEILEDMIAAYRAGAKYVVVFNYPTYPEKNPYGILQDEHLIAMQQFWDYVNEHPRRNSEKIEGKVAFVLPKDYGWGMRHPEDNIWGLWPADEKALLIWENMNKLIQKYGLELDIVYEDTKFNIIEKYQKVYLWNTTID
ncbi:MAG: hypothetical protein QXU99_01135 [Candidatus Bathyarchaeia archaeon]